VAAGVCFIQGTHNYNSNVRFNYSPIWNLNQGNFTTVFSPRGLAGERFYLNELRAGVSSLHSPHLLGDMDARLPGMITVSPSFFKLLSRLILIGRPALILKP
jgi:hypothetical protein